MTASYARSRMDREEKEIRDQVFSNISEEMKEEDDYFSSPYDVDPEERSRVERMKAIENLSESLLQKRDLAVQARASCGIEQIWREDELIFEGMDNAALRTRMIDYATQEAPARTRNTGPRRSKVVINVVRPKCETAEGRFQDIQLPTDDKNWLLKVTPVPELVRNVDNKEPAMKDGQQLYARPDGKIGDEEIDGANPATVGDVAQYRINAAKEKMARMETVINDQLTETEYNGQCRLVIRDAVRSGTGIIKGPVVSKDLKKNWKQLKSIDGETGAETIVRVLEMIEDFAPTSKRVDYWNAFPDPECGEDTTRMAYMFERSKVLPRELRNLIGVEGYLDDQIKLVLQEDPTKLTVATDRENQVIIKYEPVQKGTSYEMWEFHGDLDKDDLESLGVDCSDAITESVSACVIMINDHPVKVQLNLLDTGEIPYDFFQWSTRSGTPWGMGVPREMIWQQRVIIAAWRAMMDNAGDSAGANVVVGKDVEPMDKIYEITGKKLWKDMSEHMNRDVRKAFAQFQIENNQEQLEAIIKLAIQFIDLETNLPMIFQGEKINIPQTLGATNILIDSHNVALRSRVKLWDDAITRRHLSRYYDWNMQYHPDDDIKGDYKVDARGVSALLARDQEAQEIAEILSLRADPELRVMVDWEKAIKQYYKARNLDILLPEDQIKKNMEELRKNPPQKDPQLLVAETRANGELEKAKIQAAAEREKHEAEKVENQTQRQHEREMKIMELDIKAMELSEKTGVEMSKIKAHLSEVAQKLVTQVSLAMSKEVKPAEQVITPPMEPPGRAKEGMAFQQ